MKYSTIKKSKKNDITRVKYIAGVIISGLIYFIIRGLMAFDDSSGFIYVHFNAEYIGIIFLLIMGIALMFCLTFIKFPGKEINFEILLPPALFAAFGMMKTTSEKEIFYKDANYFPAIGFLIFLACCILMCLCSFAPAAAAGLIGGTWYNPMFPLCYGPFIILLALFIQGRKNKKAETIITAVLTAAAMIYGIFRTDISKEFLRFRKNYLMIIPLIILCAVLIYFTEENRKKKLILMPAALIPLIPVIMHILTGCYETPDFAVSAGTAAAAITIFMIGCMTKSKKLDSVIIKLKDNPAVYIIILAYILMTSAFAFIELGFSKLW